jgi:hypothetical protein
VTEQGFVLPTADFDRDIAALAADARVAIDTIQAGGVETVLVDGMPVVPQHIGFGLSALRTVSETSGGQVSISNHGEQAIDRILNATGFGYVLGYTPTKPVEDGKFRRIKVEVSRRNVGVSYRRGYFSRAEPLSFDPRRTLATTRIVTAAANHDDVTDLKVSMKLRDVRQGDRRTVRVEGLVSADQLVFAKVGGSPDGDQLAALNVAVFCTDERGVSVGELWKTLDVRIPAARLAEARATGLPVFVDVPVTRRPIFVKLVVYDYGSDRLGSKYARMF